MNPSIPIRVSVVIPTLHRYEALRHTLQCLQEQTVQPAEVWVVDQTPDVETPPGFYASFTRLLLRVIRQDQPSLTRSRNEGVRQATGEWIWLLDDDMSFGPELLATHLRVQERVHADALYGGVSEQAAMPDRYERDYLRLDPVSFFLKSPNCRWEGMVLCVSGANLLIRRDWFLRVGGFDVQMSRMEDIELGYRLYRAGACVWYSHEPFARHMRAPQGGTRTSHSDWTAAKLFSKLYLHHKHFPGWATKQYLLQLVLNALLYRDLLSGASNWCNALNPLYPLQSWIRIGKANARARQLASAPMTSA
jgi:GT2 family glycosyltransferase